MQEQIQATDSELLAEFVNRRSEAAFTELVKRHMSLVINVCRRVLNDEDASKDAAQAVFLALARKAGSLDRERALGGWLHHVAICIARNERTARMRRLRREQEAMAMQADNSTELSQDATAALRESLDQEIDALPARYRKPLVMFHLEGRSLAEVAAALGCKDGTLRVWLNRAREQLRKRLGRRGVDVTVPALVGWLAASGGSGTAVPADLVAATAKSAVLWITGGTAAAGLAPNIVALAKGALKIMFLGKLKTAAIITASVAVITTASAVSWQKVNEARDKGLPKTAIEELKPIIVDAMQNKRHAEAIKAIATKIAFEGQIEGGKAEEKITRFEAEIAKAPAEMKPVMEAILAEWYWQYFQQNRWRFTQRTQTAEAPGKDFTTWDLPRILAEIDRHFTLALSDDRQLKAIPVTNFNDLIEIGTVPDSYRPTMFDFLANEALQFYQAGEQGAAKSEDEFEVPADSPVFRPAAEFLKWTPSTTDTNSPKLKAVKIHQALLAFHNADADRSAFLDADLSRLSFGNNQAVGPEKAAKYKEALKRFAAENSNHELSAMALASLAQAISAEGEPGEAAKVAGEGMEKFPKSAGGIACYNLIQQLNSKSSSIAAERVWNEPWPVVNVSYRNVEKVFFRAVRFDFESYLKTQKWGMGNLDANQRKELFVMSPAKTWSADLPPTKDLKQRTEQVPVPKDLKPGFYIVVASHEESFAEKDNQVSFASVWVSDLALVVRQHYGSDGAQDGFVLAAESGLPLTGAVVRAFARDRNGSYKAGQTATTDVNGMFRFVSSPENGSLVFLAEHGGQQLASGQEFWSYRPGKYTPQSQTVFFTDRSLYRPGQTVQYKGICYFADTEKNDYRTLAGQALTVVLRDMNGKEVARTQQRCNDYGAFSGTFTTPSGRVTGQMSLQVENGPNGYGYFRIEEYKRPKFQVEISKPAEAAKLGGDVAVSGKASAYTGAAIGGAKVSWRVVREIRFPYWCWWGRDCLPFGRDASQNIAHGITTTSSDGSFNIKFVAAPDLSVPEKNEPTFSFTVYADVTDSTGETRSHSQSLRLGYAALQATVAGDDWQTVDKPVELTVSTTTLDGEPQKAGGSLKVYELKQPEKVVRQNLEVQPYWNYPMHRPVRAEGKVDPSNADTWETGAVVADEKFTTDAVGAAKVPVSLKAGVYRAMVETKDKFGKVVTARRTVQVVDVKAQKYAVRLPNYFAAPKWTLEPGESFLGLWGTGYDSGRAFVELSHRGKILRSWWTAADRTQEAIEQSVSEEMRGGFSLRVTFVRENRAYLNERIVDVPWSNKKLSVKWEHFTSKLEPGKKETWVAVVSGPDAKRSVAEMVAGLYDASLDQYQPHNWMQMFYVFRHENDTVNATMDNRMSGFTPLFTGWRVDGKSSSWEYRHFPADIANGWARRGIIKGLYGNRAKGDAPVPASAMPVEEASAAKGFTDAQERKDGRYRLAAEAPGSALAMSDKSGLASAAAEQQVQPDLGKVVARKNLNETAFFFPNLVSDADGVIRMEFTMPEALTEWKFLGFAHDKELRSGFITDKAVTSKDLMVEPNPPRFVREGDTIEFTAKVSNQSAARQAGKVKLMFTDARTLKSVDAALANQVTEQSFDVPSKESQTCAWRISVPDGMDFLTYKVVGATDRISDGEEGYLPVLSRRILVTESLPLPVRGAQTKSFNFERLTDSGKSKTLKSQNLTVQMVSQPAWYAVMALPYLMEYPYECSEQVFNRLYANSLARYIANGDPKIRRIFDMWKNTPALDSPLEKNQDLKSVMLEETPWLRQANAESQARRDVGILFDASRLDGETRQAFDKLAKMQLDDGLWPWFPGSRGDEFISLYIVTGFGRMRHLGVRDANMSSALKALGALDGWIDRQYREILRDGHQDDNHLNSTVAFYLYGRSFFLKDRPLDRQSKEAVDYFLGQAKKYWVKLGCRQSQGHLAIALKRFGDSETPKAIMASIKEYSVSNEEMGMFWRDTEHSWWWYRAPIETQALMVEAFDEVMGDTQAVEDCKVWLLKQKQTQDWKTTKATADAVYALLLRGTNLLASDALVEVSLGGETVKPEKVEAGTGFYEQKYVRGEIKPEMGKVVVKKSDDGVSWGSVHWQYLEDMTKVTPYEGTPLKLKKTLFIKESSKKGQVLKPVKGALSVGDELVVRVEVRVDRDMEYVHLKDQRGSGTEPVNVLSQHKYQDGLGYYESTKDTASHYFIHYLPKGVYVFEYSVRVQLKGRYQTGIASIQSIYAPEFNSHSESFELEVK